MKYPITPEYLKTVPDELAGYYRKIEEYLLKDICERFRINDTATATALEHIRNLQSRGYSYSYIKRKIKKILEITESEYRRIMQNAIEDNQRYYTSVLHEQKLVQEKFNSEAMRLEIKSIVDASLGDLKNITQSMGFSIKVKGKRIFLPIAEAYQEVLSTAEVMVWSGAKSYSEAVRDAVKELSDSGIQVVTFENEGTVYRKDHVDVAVRRAVMTSITKIADHYTQAVAEEVPTEYFETTAHSGARDKTIKGKIWTNHKAWQGRVYSTKEDDTYPSIYSVCGLGKVDGLEGINCRHMRYPFWPGISERTYTDEELANIDPPPINYNGTEYSFYEATQRQRGLERQIREAKRNLVAYKASGDEDGYNLAAAKYRTVSDELERFCEAANLRIDYDRTFVQEFTGKDQREADKAVS